MNPRTTPLTVTAALVVAAAALTIPTAPAVTQAATQDGLYHRGEQVMLRAWRQMDYTERYSFCWEFEHRRGRLRRQIMHAARTPGGEFSGLTRKQARIVWRAAADVLDRKCN